LGQRTSAHREYCESCACVIDSICNLVATVNIMMTVLVSDYFICI
jgi:hypothetical protein